MIPCARYTVEEGSHQYIRVEDQTIPISTPNTMIPCARYTVEEGYEYSRVEIQSIPISTPNIMIPCARYIVEEGTSTAGWRTRPSLSAPPTL